MNKVIVILFLLLIGNYWCGQTGTDFNFNEVEKREGTPTKCDFGKPILVVDIDTTSEQGNIALNLVWDLPEVQSILKEHLNDTTISNKLHVAKVAEPSDNLYYIRLAQFFSYSEHTVTIWHFRVNAVNKKIRVLEVIEGTYITIEEWRKSLK